MQPEYEYKPRLVDRIIAEKLRLFGAVVIIGPKWCGKTTTAEQFCKSAIYLQDPDNSKRYHEIAALHISLLLEGDNPRLIDEWQMEPELWDAVRYSVDRRHAKGLYILTGSTTYRPVIRKHSGAGRIAKVIMRTLSLYESGDSSGEVSLGRMFEGDSVSGISPHTASDIARLIVRGGWPDAVFSGGDGDVITDYCEAILDSDIFIDGKKRNRRKMELILRSLARNVSTAVSNTTIYNDVLGIDEDESDDSQDVPEEEDEEEKEMSMDTMLAYMDALEDICMIEDLPAWCPKLRSKARIRKSDVRYLSDPAIAAHFLGAGARDLEFDPETEGLLFECMVVRDLRIYAQSNNGKLYAYRDSTGLEVNCIVHLNDGRWGAIEVKLSPEKIEKGAKSLKRLKDKVDIEERNKLSFMAVVTGTGYAYTRPDGIHVIPIGCLRE